jgi:hypothetical protein
MGAAMVEDCYSAFEEDVRANDGAQAWIGLLLVTISGFASLRMLIWLVALFGEFAIH